MKKNKIRIGMPYITEPNMIGELVRETPSWLIIRIIKRTFEPKTSGTGLTHKFSKEQKEHYNDFTPYEKKFNKITGKQVGGKAFIVKTKGLELDGFKSLNASKPKDNAIVIGYDEWIHSKYWRSYRRIRTIY